MPIQGVSDRDSVDTRFRNIGKLRKGSPKINGQFGKDLTYFRFTSEVPAIVAAFEQSYGTEARELLVYLPYDEMERNFTSWRELYGQNGLVKARCDGANIVDWIDGERHYHGTRECVKEFRDTPNRCPDCPLKQVGRLSVILPDLWEAGYIGLVTAETHSWNDIATISGKLVQWEPLQGKPFTLWREDVKIGAPIKGKRAAITKSLVKIELTNEFLFDTYQASQRAALAEVNPVAALLEPELPPGNGGYEEPDYVEMPETEKPTETTNGNGGGFMLSEKAMKAILDAGHAENPANAARMVNLSAVLVADDSPEVFVAWAKEYRAARDAGKEAPEAAKVADTELAKLAELAQAVGDG